MKASQSRVLHDVLDELADYEVAHLEFVGGLIGQLEHPLQNADVNEAIVKVEELLSELCLFKRLEEATA